MFNVWKKNKTRDLGEIEIIDIAQKSSIQANWAVFFIREHYWITSSFEQSYLSLYPRRSCEAFASSSLYNDPWGDIESFVGNSLSEYHKWINRIIQSEELHDIDNANPLSRW